MAFAATTLWEVQQSGDDVNNGGGWDAASTGTDKTQSAVVTRTDLIIDGTTNTKATSAAIPFAASDVGNVMAVTAGTGFTVQRVQAVSLSGVTMTFDKSLGTLGSTGGTGGLGGPLATPGQAMGLITTASSGQTMWIKYSASPYIITTTTANVAGGRLNSTGGGSSTINAITIQGYDVVRGDLTVNRPTLQAGVNSFVMCTVQGNATRLANLIFDPAAQTGIDGVNASGAGVMVFRVKAKSNNSYAFTGQTGVTFSDCEVNGGSASNAFNLAAANCDACVVNGGTYNQMFNGGAGLVDCIATGGANVGFNNGNNTTGTLYKNCVAYANGIDGFRSTQNGGGVCYKNCISYGNTLIGFNLNAGAVVLNCAAGANTPNFSTGIINANGNITLTANPFTNAAAGDYSLNNTAGGGLAVQAAGWNGAFPATIATTSFLDLGIAQHRIAARGILRLFSLRKT